MSPKIVLTGGGTGGHITPNMALLPYLRREGFEVNYIGSLKGMEKGLIEPLGIPYYGIDSERLNRYLTLENLATPFHVIRGLFQAGKLMKKLRPDVVFSKGGFVSVPVVAAAWLHHVPVVCHESDITPGLANKLSSPLAKKVCVNFEEALQYVKQGKGVYTGTPIRDELLAGSRENGLKLAGFSGEKPVLLVMGGSTGAQAVNEGLREALDLLLERFDVIHLCGKGNLDENLKDRRGYFQIEYANKEMADFYAAADLTLSRAGANALAEILALNLPNVLIPLPLAASRGDQILNARSFTEKGFSFTLDQEKMTKESLYEAVCTVYDGRDRYIAEMKKDQSLSGSERVLDVIQSVLRAQ